MSIDIDWERLTSGPDGLALAESIREFLHGKFQQIELPRFIQSVRVHAFEFGAAGPEVEIKDICDPLPDFYEDDVDVEEDEGHNDQSQDLEAHKGSEKYGSRPVEQLHQQSGIHAQPGPDAEKKRLQPPSYIDIRHGSLRSMFSGSDQISHPSLGVTTPGIPGGTSNLSYFHSPLTTGLSGTQTPLAAVAGKNLSADYGLGPPGISSDGAASHHHDGSATSFSRPSTAESLTSAVSDASPGRQEQSKLRVSTQETRSEQILEDVASSPQPTPEARAEDLQIMSRVRYSGDVKLSLTAEILLDYPMPSFVGIPLRLNITGLSFDGVAVLAWIRSRAHFCFLSPEDASSIIGEDEAYVQSLGTERSNGLKKTRNGGLLQEIRVESEIGQRENGKQSLKNVGKVERFVLEQVRRIFEDELVYPSFWTFLV